MTTVKQNNPTENSPPVHPILAPLKGLINVFFDNGKLNISKLVVGIFIIICSMAYYHKKDIKNYLLEANVNNAVTNYVEIKAQAKKMDYEASIVNSTQGIYTVLKPDTVAVYMYRPEDTHQYRELVHYEGLLPEGTNPEQYKNGIDKSSEEYTNHIMGAPYSSEKVVQYDHVEGVNRFYYTCPIFNTRLMYVGYVGMYWDDVVPKYKPIQMFTQCTNAARQIGVNMD